MFESTSPTLLAPSFTTLYPEEHFGYRVRVSVYTGRAQSKGPNGRKARGDPGWR